MVPNYASIKVQVNSLLDLSVYELSMIIPNCFLLEITLVILMTVDTNGNVALGEEITSLIGSLLSWKCIYKFYMRKNRISTLITALNSMECP